MQQAHCEISAPERDERTCENEETSFQSNEHDQKHQKPVSSLKPSHHHISNKGRTNKTINIRLKAHPRSVHRASNHEVGKHWYLGMFLLLHVLSVSLLYKSMLTKIEGERQINTGRLQVEIERRNAILSEHKSDCNQQIQTLQALLRNSKGFLWDNSSTTPRESRLLVGSLMHQGCQSSLQMVSREKPQDALNQQQCSKLMEEFHKLQYENKKLMGRELQRIQRLPKVDETELLALPSPWTSHLHPSGRVYYFNHQTGTSSWHDPRKVKSPSESDVSGQATQTGTDETLSESKIKRPALLPAAQQMMLDGPYGSVKQGLLWLQGPFSVPNLESCLRADSLSRARSTRLREWKESKPPGLAISGETNSGFFLIKKLSSLERLRSSACPSTSGLLGLS